MSKGRIFQTVKLNDNLVVEFVMGNALCDGIFIRTRRTEASNAPQVIYLEFELTPDASDIIVGSELTVPPDELCIAIAANEKEGKATYLSPYGIFGHLKNFFYLLEKGIPLANILAWDTLAPKTFEGSLDEGADLAMEDVFQAVRLDDVYLLEFGLGSDEEGKEEVFLRITRTETTEAPEKIYLHLIFADEAKDLLCGVNADNEENHMFVSIWGGERSGKESFIWRDNLPGIRNEVDFLISRKLPIAKVLAWSPFTSQPFKAE